VTPAAFAFDLYGTLVDYTSLRLRLAEFSDAPLIDIWRAKQLQYSFMASLMDRYADFDELTARALDYAAAQCAVELPAAARSELVDAWSQLPAYSEVPDVLTELRRRGARTAVLTNGTPRALARTLKAAGISDAVDGALSVDAVRIYKPSPRVYQLAVDFFGLERSAIGFVSSNGWDALGAGEFGFTVFWCNRSGLPAETFGAQPARTISSLRDLLEP
jgi:2-haloacid dehalogenase